MRAREAVAAFVIAAPRGRARYRKQQLLPFVFLENVRADERPLLEYSRKYSF